MGAGGRSEQTLVAAMAQHRAGRLSEAERLYRLACDADPKNARAYHLLGVVAHQLGRPDAAALVGRAVALDPNFAEAHNDRGVILAANGLFAEALACFEKAVALKPGYDEARSNLGRGLRSLGRLDEALVQFEQVAKSAADSPVAHFNLAAALELAGRHHDAEKHYRSAVSLRPDFADAHAHLAALLQNIDRLPEALAHAERAVALRPDSAGARNNFGNVLRALGRHEDAIAQYQRAIALDPNAFMAHYNCGMALRGETRIAEARTYFARALALKPDFPNPPAPGEPVRLGIVSGFFKQHSNWKIPIKGWLTKVDRARFHVTGYYTGEGRDQETAAAESLCDRFVQGPLSLDAWRRTILSDAPHVLIFPEIGMDKVSAQLAAQRLTAVQCASWGHPVTSGFPTIDYFIGSELMEPADASAHYSERLIRLPNLSIYYEAPDAAPAPLSRKELSLRAGAVVYWCCQSLPKYLPQFDEVFPRIAKEVPDCQFAFIEFVGGSSVTETFKARLDRAFCAAGLDIRDHCVFLPRLAPDCFAAAIGQCDVVLDSIGWSGCNSILEGLVHNLPIVTIAGEMMRGRHGAAILEMMEVRDTMARTVDEYVSMAGLLGRDAAKRAELSARIANNKHRIYRDDQCIKALERFLDGAVRDNGVKFAKV